MHRTTPAFTFVALLVAMAALPAGTADGAEDGRAFSVRYVATPRDPGTGSDPESGIALGGVAFALLDGESRVLVTIADDVSDRTEVTAVFFFGNSPIRHTITFCQQHGMDVPERATHMRLVVERLVGFGPEVSTCGPEHGALTGTLDIRVA